MAHAVISTRSRSAKALVSAVLLMFALSACAEAGPKTAIGAAGGAAAGGLTGAAAGEGAEGIIGGVLLGGLLGGAVGNALDRRDREYANRTVHRSLETSPSGTTSAWQNPDSEHSGTVTPTRTYEAANGQYCREFQQTLTVGGQTEQAYGTACRQPDGGWKIVQ